MHWLLLMIHCKWSVFEGVAVQKEDILITGLKMVLRLTWLRVDHYNHDEITDWTPDVGSVSKNTAKVLPESHFPHCKGAVVHDIYNILYT